MEIYKELRSVKVLFKMRYYISGIYIGGEYVKIKDCDYKGIYKRLRLLCMDSKPFLYKLLLLYIFFLILIKF